MLTQHYAIVRRNGTFDDAEVGGMVFRNDTDNDVIGFVSDVSSSRLEIVLFDADEIDIDGAINLDVTYDWKARLLEICMENSGIAEHWHNACQ